MPHPNHEDDVHAARSRPVHLPNLEVLNRSTIIFLTVCVTGRRPLLARPDIQSLLETTWSRSSAWLVGKYVLMPDHVHLNCAPATRDALPLANWVRFWKSWSTREWPYPNEVPVWQRNFWDRQLRSRESYSEKWSYIEMNPVRAGLCTKPEAWPFRGELNPFRYHDA